NVQRAIALASAGEMVRCGSAGTPVPDLCRNDPGIGEGNHPWHTTRDDAIHKTARADVRRRGIALRAFRIRSTRTGAPEGATGGTGTKRNLGKACGDGCESRAV